MAEVVAFVCLMLFCLKKNKNALADVLLMNLNILEHCAVNNLRLYLDVVNLHFFLHYKQFLNLSLLEKLAMFQIRQVFIS